MTPQAIEIRGYRFEPRGQGECWVGDNTPWPVTVKLHRQDRRRRPVPPTWGYARWLDDVLTGQHVSPISACAAVVEEIEEQGDPRSVAPEATYRRFSGFGVTGDGVRVARFVLAQPVQIGGETSSAFTVVAEVADRGGLLMQRWRLMRDHRQCEQTEEALRAWCMHER